jgi:curli biogenesis system outer membrane secretion channel CsgG
MLTPVIVLLAIGWFQQGPAEPPPAQKNQQADTADTKSDLAERLLKAKRIYVESFGEDGINKTLQAMVIDAFTSTKRFIVTENKDKADLILKGSAIEKTSQELHAIGSATAVAGAAGHYSGRVYGTPERVTGSSSGGFASRSAGIEDSQASTETINDARVSVRLVSPDGDVVWSTTQESTGAKYKGATADVADKIVKQLLHDMERLPSPPSDRKQN